MYKPEQYQDQFEGSIQSTGFSPVKAVDNSKKIQQQTAAQGANIRRQAQAAAAQAKVDMQSLAFQAGEQKRAQQGQNAYMRLQQTTERLDAQSDYAQSQKNAALFKGLLSLTKTGMEGYEMYKKHQAEQKEFDEILDATGMSGMEPPTIDMEAAADDVRAADAAITADAQAANAVAAEYEEQGDIGIANQLQQGSAYNIASGVRGNVMTARMSHNAYLQEAYRSIPDDQKPKTQAEAMQLMRSLNAQFFRDAGLSGVDKRRLAKDLAPTILNNTQNLMTSAVSAGVKAEREANLAQAKSNVANLIPGLANGTLSIEEAVEQVTDNWAFGNVGFTGRSSASNRAALLELGTQLAAQGRFTDIERLKGVELVKGNKGTTIGKLMGDKLDKLVRVAETKAVTEYNRTDNLNKLEIKKRGRAYFDDPSPENKKAYAEYLLSNGSEMALAELKRIEGGMGLDYDPSTYFELQMEVSKGNPPSRDQVEEMLNAKIITAEQARSLMPNNDDYARRQEVDKYLKSNSRMLQTSLAGNHNAPLPLSAKDLKGAFGIEFNHRMSLLKFDVAEMMSAAIKSDPSILKDPREMLKLQNEMVKQLLQTPEYQLEWSTGEKWKFKADANRSVNLSAIRGRDGVNEDYSSFSMEQLDKARIPLSEMSYHDDRWFSTDVLRMETKKFVDKGYVGPRTTAIAAKFGVPVKALLDAQLKQAGLPSLSVLSKEVKAESVSVPTTGDIPDEKTGFAYLQGSDFNFSRKGAAYIASAINHESAWRGNRQWGQVAGDGTNRNGGLISWASWSHNSARLGAIERHFGKNIAQIPEVDQLRYMEMEMKNNYREAYRIFQNPNSSSADLQWAVRNYWGFDPRYTGNRWRDAERLIASS